MNALAVFMILSLIVPLQVQYALGDRVVVIRIDDIQDYPQNPSFSLAEKEVLRFHVDARIPALLAIIGSRFGTDQGLVEQVRSGITQGVFTVGIHGWHHESFSNLSRSEQTTQIQYAKNRLESLLAIEVLALVPPFGDFNRGTIDAMKANGLTLISSATYTGDLPRIDGGIQYLPQTVTTAEVDAITDSWVPLSLDEIVRQIEGSWSAYGVAVVVIHPRQFVDSNEVWQNDRWEAYVKMIEWIKVNQGTIIRPDPAKPPSNVTLNPFFISVVTFSGLTSTLLIAFNASSRRSRAAKAKLAPRSVRKETTANYPSAEVKQFEEASSPPIGIGFGTGLVNEFVQARLSTKLLLSTAFAASAVVGVLWVVSGRTYLNLGFTWLGVGFWGVGFFQGKIFWSSIITWTLTLTLSYFAIVERQRKHPAVGLVVSGLVVLSAAYVFEYIYLFLNHQVLFNYLDRFHWWFNLLAGFVVGFGLRLMRPNRVAFALLSAFAVLMAVWYLGGYPQLADKETPVFIYTNYIGIPVNWAYPLNALAKLFASLGTAALLLGGQQGVSVGPSGIGNRRSATEAEYSG